MIEQMNPLLVRARRHAALSDVVRLAVVDALALGDRSPGELQSALDLPSKLLAHHLKVLAEAGIISRCRSEGDRRRTYLTFNEQNAADPAAELRADRVVFVCTANSARWQLAAALWAQVGDIPATSAGTAPAERVSPGALAAAERHSLSLLGGDPQRFVDVVADRDLVVAVCDNAYEELGQVVDVHWSIPDPVRNDSDAAFEAAFAELSWPVGQLAPCLSGC